MPDPSDDLFEDETREIHTPPGEVESRIVEDADARGTPVILQDRQTWYVPPLTFSDRGGRILDLMERLEAKEVDHTAAQRLVELRTGELEDSEDADALDGLGRSLNVAREARNKSADDLLVLQSAIAYHALRGFYRLSREDVDALVTQRHWQEVVNALNGLDTKESEVEAALAILGRVKRDEGEGDPTPPFVRSSSGAGVGVS